MSQDVTLLYVTYLPVEVILSFFESCEDGDGDVKALELILGDGREPTVLHGTETQTELSNTWYYVIKDVCMHVCSKFSESAVTAICVVRMCMYVCSTHLISEYLNTRLLVPDE